MTIFVNYQEELAFASLLADAAWAAIQPHFRNGADVSDKSHLAPKGSPKADFDPVTAADTGAERAMRALIEAQRPHHGIIGEEFPPKNSESGFTWLLDPVDGTRAFVAGLPVWTTLIALCDPDGVPVLGVIDQPVLKERYLGWPGGAALQTETGRQPIHVSGCTSLDAAVIATTDPFILQPAEQNAWRHLRQTAPISRYGLDAYAYARLAAGTIDLVAETGLQSWDVAALIPVVRGAGGVATDWAGNPPQLGGQILCAASDALLDQALSQIKSA